MTSTAKKPEHHITDVNKSRDGNTVMKMPWSRSLLFLVLILCGVCSANHDVSSVLFRGDCRGFGMRIEGAYQADGAFLVSTTGARFEYAAGKLKIYQGLGNDVSRRLVATMTIEDVNEFEKVESNDDHVLFWSEKLNIGIYGDSTCILAPKQTLSIRIKGNFKPDYEGRYNGELLLIDDFGGIDIYPQWHETGYEVKDIELGKRDWTAFYNLNPGERVMIAAFPARAFDWGKSFKSQMVFLQEAMGRGKYNPDGQTLPDNVFLKWSRFIDIVVMWDQIYRDADYRGPYVIGNEPDFRRALKTCQEAGMKVIAYTSPYANYLIHKSSEPCYEQMKHLRDRYGIDGVYMDGLRGDYGYGETCDKIVNWEMVRRVRQLFGPDGVIVFHGTHGGNAVATAPNIDTYCDITLYGENIPFKSVDDPYVRYQVRKYGISNAIAIWVPGPHPDSITTKDMIDAMLKMNGRYFWWGEGGLRTGQPPPNNWKVQPGPMFRYYMGELEKIKQSYRSRKKSSE
jgi:hypothetical protein